MKTYWLLWALQTAKGYVLYSYCLQMAILTCQLWIFILFMFVLRLVKFMIRINPCEFTCSTS